MKRSIRKVRSTLLVTLLVVFVILFVDLVNNLNKHRKNFKNEIEEPQKIRSKFTNLVKDVVKTFDTKNTQENKILQTPDSVTHPGLLKDWHDYKSIKIEKKRTGPGEQGKPVVLNDTLEIKENDAQYDKTGYSVIVSNKISVNRSIPDNRPDMCKDLLYFENLPNVSVVIIFHNEIFSILKRTLHSIWNRTPPKLLHEIILVNDNSTYPELYGPLEKYTKKFFPGKVKIKNLEQRSGLMVARNEGAKLATGEVLVFFDSHIEVNVNYLPPLLEPIVKNGRVGTVPIHDYIEPDTFEYMINPGFTGSRGIVDWKFDFHEFQKRDEDMITPFRPFPNPVMLGCGFSIKRNFFFELGGFDDGMQIWNGENYEMSFKLWLCGEGLFQVPCSRIGHSFRDFTPSRKFNFDYVARNFKRLAEVWLDEYKEVLYASNPDRYKDVDPGDLTKRKSIKKNLNCKPFKYFLDIVAPDMTNVHPPFIKPPAFASGAIESVAFKQCISRPSTDILEATILRECSKNRTNPKASQNFYLSFNRKIVHKKSYTCFDSYKPSLFECNGFNTGNQYWKYDLKTQMLINGIDDSDLCLTVFKNSTMGTAKCDSNDYNQKWTFGYVNTTALNNWDSIFGYTSLL